MAILCLLILAILLTSCTALADEHECDFVYWLTYNLNGSENIGPSYEVWGCTICQKTNTRNQTGYPEHECEFYLYMAYEPRIGKAGFETWECIICHKTEYRNETPALTEHECVYGYSETMEPTCIYEGYEVWYCSICDREMFFNETPKLTDHQPIITHNWDYGFPNDDCTRELCVGLCCDICNEHVDPIWIDPEFSQHELILIETIPNGDGSGGERYGCTNVNRFGEHCKYTEYRYASEGITGQEHKHEMVLDENIAIRPATCLRTGTEYYICSYIYPNGTQCQHMESRDLPIITTHTPDKETIPETCRETAYIHYSCSICDDSDIEGREWKDSPEHDYSALYERPATCAEYSYGAKWTMCSRCGAYGELLEITPRKTDHAFKMKKVYVEGTWCGGHMYYEQGYCDICGYVEPARDYNYYTEGVSEDETGHIFNNDYIVEPATCTMKGVKLISCECGAYTEKVVAIPMHGSTLKTDQEARPATCTATGLTESKFCTVCKQVIVARETVPALGHFWYDAQVIEPTETENGYTLMRCTRCPATKTGYITTPKPTAAPTTTAPTPAPEQEEIGNAIGEALNQDAGSPAVEVKVMTNEQGENTVILAPASAEGDAAQPATVTLGEEILDTLIQQNVTTLAIESRDWGAGIEMSVADAASAGGTVTAEITEEELTEAIIERIKDAYTVAGTPRKVIISVGEADGTPANVSVVLACAESAEAMRGKTMVCLFIDEDGNISETEAELIVSADGSRAWKLPYRGAGVYVMAEKK